MRRLWLVLLLLSLASQALAQGREREPREPRLRGTGTGFAVSSDGHVLTNAHVVRGCRTLRLRRPDDSLADAQLVVASRREDLALLKTEPVQSVAPFRQGRRLRPGDAVVAFGFPLAGTLSKSGNLTLGHVTALAGIADDDRFLQISTPIQPGNSGGPLLDMNGRVVGITTASLGSRSRDALQLQNVNFAIKGEVAAAFLERNGVAVETEGGSKRAMKPADVGARARRFTLRVECLA